MLYDGKKTTLERNFIFTFIIFTGKITFQPFCQWKTALLAPLAPPLDIKSVHGAKMFFFAHSCCRKFISPRLRQLLYYSSPSHLLTAGTRSRPVRWLRALHWAHSHNTLNQPPLEDFVTLYSLSPDFQEESCQNAFPAEWVLTNSGSAGRPDEKNFREEERHPAPRQASGQDSNISFRGAWSSWRLQPADSQWDDDDWRCKALVLNWF